MADEKIPGSSDESGEPTPTEGNEVADQQGPDSEVPAELTADAEIDDPRDTPDDDYVDDPATPDINEAKLDRATDEVAADDDAVPVDPAPRRRPRASRPVRRTQDAAAAEASAGAESEPEAADELESVAATRPGAGRVRSTAPVRRERANTDSDADQRTTPARFVAQSIGELRKVVWPTGTQVQQYFVVVLVFVLFIMTIVSLLDLGFGWLILRLFG
ncbi:MAG: preprotein translocase subunit SecE [Propionibacteriaceae bacterium]|nr:preprotein translocase subunit SecE [Propionibacteriaceae bacterium]